MKFLTSTLITLLLTTVTSSAYSFGSSGSQAALVDDDKFPVPGDQPLFFCKDPKDYILEVHNVDLIPNPPKPGETLKIVANGTFHKDIKEGATVFLQVRYGLITLIKQEADLCDNLPKIDLECPIKKGLMKIEKEVDLPKAVPPGKYTVLADVNTVDKEAITCMEAQITFNRQS